MYEYPDRLKDISGQVEIIDADIRNLTSVQNACEGIDCVCHLAYLNGTEFLYQAELVLDIGIKE